MAQRLFRRKLPTVEQIVEAIEIDLDKGTFIYRERPLSAFTDERICKSWNARFAGKPSGHIDRNGYLAIGLLRSKFMAHRLLWKVATDGDEPDELDHIDRNPLNNSLANLRVATRSENNRNRRLSEYNTSGFRGVYKGRDNRWVSQLKINGTGHHLGVFDTIDQAIAARQGAEKILGLTDPSVDQKGRK